MEERRERCESVGDKKGTRRRLAAEESEVLETRCGGVRSRRLSLSLSDFEPAVSLSFSPFLKPLSLSISVSKVVVSLFSVSEAASLSFPKRRLCAYPKGKDNVDCLSMYVQVADFESMPSGWRRYANFQITIVNFSFR